MTVTKAVLSKQLFDNLGFNKHEAREFVDLFFEEIQLELESNKNVKISGFGRFELRDKKARPGRNPKKKDTEITISARRVVTYKAAQKLSALVNENTDKNIL